MKNARWPKKNACRKLPAFQMLFISGCSCSRVRDGSNPDSYRERTARPKGARPKINLRD